MSVLDQETTEQYRERAAESHAATLEAWEKEFGPVAGVNAGAAGQYVASGTANFATAFIWGTMVVRLTFVDGTSAEFEGRHWGAGLGGGTSFGAAFFSVPSSQLAGGGTYSVAAIPGLLTVTFYKNNVPVGTFNGSALSVGSMVVGGSGQWT